jgi:hypothetical protein
VRYEDCCEEREEDEGVEHGGETLVSLDSFSTSRWERCKAECGEGSGEVSSGGARHWKECGDTDTLEESSWSR